MSAVLTSILSLALDTAPWLLLGLLLAGLVQPLLPQHLIRRLLGGNRAGAILRGSIIGVPLPLCSCGAIPTALALHRAGAGRGPATSFLVSTPGVGIDSLTLSYALLGPVMMLARMLGAVLTAFTCGILVTCAKDAPMPAAAQASCCNDPCDNPDDRQETARPSLKAGLNYALSDLWDDIRWWIAGGIIVAGGLIAVIPEAWLMDYGQGLLAMLILSVVGIPLYICATAATPLAVAMLMMGVSPGATLVFLLAAPITSSATLAVYWRNFGPGALSLYLIAIIGSSIALGLSLDALIVWQQWSITAHIGDEYQFFPHWVQWACLLALIILACPPLRRRLFVRNPKVS